MLLDDVEKLETLEPTGKTKVSYQVKGTVDGHYNTVIHYDFDKDGKLFCIYYSFSQENLSSIETINSEYLDIRTQLIEKYGDPIALSDGEHFKVTGKGIEMFYTFYNMGQMGVKMLGDNFVSASDEWVLVLPEGYIKIEHFAYCTEGIREGSKSVSGGHYIYYQYYSKKEWDSFLHGLK